MLPWYGALLFGLFGGFVAELASVTQHRQKLAAERPEWLNERFYWFIGAAWVISGGVLALAESYQTAGIGAVSAVTVGATAPLIIERFISGSKGSAAGGPPGTVN